MAKSAPPSPPPAASPGDRGSPAGIGPLRTGPGPAAGAAIREMVDRRAFLRSAFGGSLGLAAALAWPIRMAAGSLAAAAPGPDVAAAAKAATGVARARQPESTRRMAALLEKITREADPLRNPFRNVEQVAILSRMQSEATEPAALLKIRMQLAWQYLDAGNPDEALKEYEAIQQVMEDNRVPPAERQEPEWLTFAAMCHLRMGENENCCANHNADSCLFPIHGKGIHTLQRGSRGAVGVLTELLEKYPGDLRARWLLNVAYMTLGEYPDKVPVKWLLEPRLFASDFDIKHFPDIAGDVGLDVPGLAGGVALEDFDNDGFLDLMVSSWGVRDQLRLFRNNGNGTFTERTEEAGLTGLTGGLNLIHCDYNNDGFMDVLVLRGAWLGTEGHYPCSLLRNNGDFTFTDVTEEAGLLRFHPTNSAVWFDYNGDGWIDLFIANESKAGDRNPCELFRNNGDGTFTECAAENGVDLVGFYKAVASADFNNDGRPDLFLSRLDGPKVLLRNDGAAGADRSARAPWRFTDVAEAAGITGPPASFTCWFWDYNNDGWPDILVTGYVIQDVGDIAADYLGLPYSGQRAKLYRNNGDGTFTDATKECGLDKLLLAMGANFGDLDNDGWLDFYLGTGNPELSVLIPNRMFRNDGGKRFQDVTTAGGFGQLQKGHGVAFGDINNSGTQDIYCVIGGAVEGDHFHNQLYANPGHGNNWLKLKLEGVRTNRAAIGARIKVVVQTDDGERAIHRIVGTGGSFGSATLRQEIGLGKASVIRRVEIYWPVTGNTQVVAGLQVNRLYHVREGVADPAAVDLRSFRWPAASGA
jgi:hypothetical protein